ncbi:MAG: response regulator [bacterium]
MRPKILILDDDVSIRRLCTLLLDRSGYDTDSVESGEDALVYYEREQKAGTPYAAVILDLTVKTGMGGLEVLPKLRAMNPRVYTIVASGSSIDTMRNTFKAQGFNDVLPKPFRPQDLAECLQKLAPPSA